MKSFSLANIISTFCNSVRSSRKYRNQTQIALTVPPRCRQEICCVELIFGTCHRCHRGRRVLAVSYGEKGTIYSLRTVAGVYPQPFRSGTCYLAAAHSKHDTFSLAALAGVRYGSGGNRFAVLSGTPLVDISQLPAGSCRLLLAGGALQHPEQARRPEHIPGASCSNLAVALQASLIGIS